MNEAQKEAVLEIMGLHSIANKVLVNSKEIGDVITSKKEALLKTISDDEVQAFMMKEMSRIDSLAEEYLLGCLKK